MDIPDCYDPVYQAERREAESERAERVFPLCVCCGNRVLPGGKFYELDVGKDFLIVCGDCVDTMLDYPCIVEELEY